MLEALDGPWTRPPRTGNLHRATSHELGRGQMGIRGERRTADDRPALRPGSFFGVTASSRSSNGFALAESVYRAHHIVPTHQHERAFFYLMLDGSSCDTTRRRELSCVPGMLVYHPPEEAHSNTWHDTGGRCFHIEIPPDRLEPLDRTSPALRRAGYFVSGPLVWLAQRLHREFRCPDAASALAVEGLALELIAGAHREAYATGRSGKPPRWLATARDAALERCTEDLTVTTLAREAGVHPAHLARAFRAAYHCSVGEFVRRARIARACERLSRGGVSLGRVANDLGFYDQSHFSRTFKRVVGEAPSQFVQRLGVR
jgi:AraC family transcriptional regulator